MGRDIAVSSVLDGRHLREVVHLERGRDVRRQRVIVPDDGRNVLDHIAVGLSVSYKTVRARDVLDFAGRRLRNELDRELDPIVDTEVGHCGACASVRAKEMEGR